MQMHCTTAVAEHNEGVNCRWSNLMQETDTASRCCCDEQSRLCCLRGMKLSWAGKGSRGREREGERASSFLPSCLRCPSLPFAMLLLLSVCVGRREKKEVPSKEGDQQKQQTVTRKGSARVDRIHGDDGDQQPILSCRVSAHPSALTYLTSPHLQTALAVKVGLSRIRMSRRSETPRRLYPSSRFKAGRLRGDASIG